MATVFSVSIILFPAARLARMRRQPLPYRNLSSIGALTCSERTAFADTRLRRFNIRRRTGTSRARNIWRGYRGHAFPWSDGLDYYSDPGQRALDFLLHPANFGT